MESVLSLVPLLLIVGVNTLVAALLTRLFRVRLETPWGAAVFVALFVPLVATFVTVVVGSVGGASVGSRGAAFGLFVLLPLALGVTFDVFWMPAPDDVELPATTGE